MLNFEALFHIESRYNTACLNWERRHVVGLLLTSLVYEINVCLLNLGQNFG